MRGDVVYCVYGVHEGREQDVFFGAFRTCNEAGAEISRLVNVEQNGRNWAEQYHDHGFVIRETVVQTNFEIPPRPKPRDRYFVRSTSTNRPGTWPSTVVEVFQRTDVGGQPKKVVEYERNYALLQTFEPFRQGDRDFALISPRYTGTSVLDLATGRVIAAEPESSAGFCPVGFYVPDWWDVHDGRLIPGSEYWSFDCEWPIGKFGFVWGCIWGDDSAWKVQYLDLSGVRDGVIRREERFGYAELATDGYQSPCIDSETAPPGGSDPPPFIKVWLDDGIPRVRFAIEMEFDLASGRPKEWQRLNVANFE
jgi:hypothetical protein